MSAAPALVPQPTASEIHPFARELAQKLGAGGKRIIFLKARTLLKRFGFYRRTAAIVEEVATQLGSVNLASDLTLVYPPELDDKIEIHLLEQAAPAPGAPIQAAQLSQSGPTVQMAQPTLAVQAAPVLPTTAADSTDPMAVAVESTVEVFADTGSGSGFIVHPSGLVVTARHVVNDEAGLSLRKVKVSLHPQLDNEQTLDGVVFRSHKKLDFALLWLDGPGPFPSIPLGTPRKVRYTQTVYAIGSPAGMPNTVSRGIISNPRSLFNHVECLQTDAAIDHGNSGGPLVNENGEVLGINLWGLGNYDAAKFAVPVDYLYAEIASALQHGRAACLKAVYCPVCGYCDFEEQHTWFCRGCGKQWTPEEQLPPIPPELSALAAEALSNQKLALEAVEHSWCYAIWLKKVAGCIFVVALKDGVFYLSVNAPVLVAEENEPKLDEAGLLNLAAGNSPVEGAIYRVKEGSLYFSLCTQVEGLSSDNASPVARNFEDDLVEVRKAMLSALKPQK